MSLVYDALRQQADPARPAPAPARASWWSRRSAAARSGVLVGAGALLSVPVAFLLVAAGTTPAAPAQEPAPVGTSYATVDTATTTTAAAAGTAPFTPEASDAAWPEPSTIATAVDGSGNRQEIRFASQAQDPIGGPPVDATVAQAPESVSPAASAAAPAPLPMEVAAVTPGTPPATAALAPPPPASTGANAAIPSATAAAPISIRVERRATAVAPAPGGDAMAVEETIGRIEAAVAAGDAADAEHALATLGTLLHPDSLTLLRMRAWVAHGSNDMATAEELYRRIASRVPDDVNAGVNIALLDAARGQVDDARSRLLRLSGRHSRSPLVARALAELEALPQ